MRPGPDVAPLLRHDRGLQRRGRAESAGAQGAPGQDQVRVPGGDDNHDHDHHSATTTTMNKMLTDLIAL